MGKNNEFDIEKLKGGENYHNWSFAIKTYLEFKSLGKCLPSYGTDGRQTAASETDASKLTNCKAILTLTVDTTLFVHIRSCNTASEIWNKFKNLYEDKGLTRKIGLLRNLIGCKLENYNSMQEYIGDIKESSQKLNGIGFVISEDWTTAILLAGLTDKYQSFIMGIQAVETDLNSDLIISKLIDLNGGEGNSGGGGFFGKGNKSKKGAKNNKFKDSVCEFCNKKGHTKPMCFSYKKTVIAAPLEKQTTPSLQLKSIHQTNVTTLQKRSG